MPVIVETVLNRGNGRVRVDAALIDYWEPTGDNERTAPLALRDIWEVVPDRRLNRVRKEPLNPVLMDTWDKFSTDREREGTFPSLAFVEIEELPWFDPHAADNPFALPVPPRVEVEAERRARWLIGLLHVPEPRRRRYLKDYFVSIFAGLGTPASFRSLSSLAVDGVPADIIVAACEFRAHWEDTPRLRSRRSRYEAGIHDASLAQLSWPRAARMCSLCDPIAPQSLIEETWYFQWLELPHGDELFWSFLDFVESRLRLRSNGYWEPADPWARRGLSDDRQRSWGIVPLGSFSRTGEMIRGRFDQVAPPSDDD